MTRGKTIQYPTFFSRAARTSANQLFVIKVTDAFPPHSQAPQTRGNGSEQASSDVMDRLAVFVVCRNLLKRRFENGPVENSAMVGDWMELMWGWGTCSGAGSFGGRCYCRGGGMRTSGGA